MMLFIKFYPFPIDTKTDILFNKYIQFRFLLQQEEKNNFIGKNRREGSPENDR